MGSSYFKDTLSLDFQWHIRLSYSVFHWFRRAKFACGGSTLSSSQFLPLSSCLGIKVVKIDWKIIISIPWSKSVKQTVWWQIGFCVLDTSHMTSNNVSKGLRNEFQCQVNVPIWRMYSERQSTRGHCCHKNFEKSIPWHHYSTIFQKFNLFNVIS